VAVREKLHCYILYVPQQSR